MDLVKTISNILPWILLALLLYFTLLLISYVVGIRQAKKREPSLEPCVSKKGKIFIVIEVSIYFIVLIISIILFINKLRLHTDLTNAITIFNPLTVYTLLFALHIQDVIFVGKKNILIGSKMYEYRRMKKVAFPKKSELQYVYGQQEVKVSLFFTDITELKKRLAKTK